MSVSHPVRLLREELQLLQEQGSYVGEVVRAMDKKKVLVKVKAASPRDHPLHSHAFMCSLPRTAFCHIILGLMGRPGGGWWFGDVRKSHEPCFFRCILRASLL